MGLRRGLPLLLAGAAATALAALFAAGVAPTSAPGPAARPAPAAARAATSPVPVHPAVRASSANWAGRLATSDRGAPPFTRAGMRVTVPAVSCPENQDPGQTWMLSVWTGLGGWDGGTLYQAGLEVTCAAGNPVAAYDAFYEAVRPGGAPIVDVVPHTVLTPLATHPVAAGDRLRADVELAAGTVRFTLTDAAADAPAGRPRWAESIPVVLRDPPAPVRSAGCIVERPSITDTATGAVSLAHLPDFSPVFTDPGDECTAADAAGSSGRLGEPSDRWPETVVAMTPDDGDGAAQAGGSDPAHPLRVTWQPGR